MFRLKQSAPSSALTTILVAGLVLFGWGAAPAAEDLKIEAEEYESYGVHDLGGLPIGIEFCASASGYFTVDWIDVPGEWIMLKVTIVNEADYASTLAYQAPYGEAVAVRATVLDYPEPGQSVTSDYQLDGGYGFG